MAVAVESGSDGRHTLAVDDFEALGLTAEDLRRMYYFMLLTRKTEMRVVSLYRQGKIVGGVYTGTGNEATAVASAYALAEQDVLCPMHRDLGAHYVRGQTVRRILAQYLGRRDGIMRGRDGNMHQGDMNLNIISMISHLGASIPVCAGAALAACVGGKDYVAMTYIGDGGSSIGDFHEGLNFAAALRLPMVLIIENNQFAYSTPTDRQFACKKLSDRAKGYGIPGVTVDGTDALEVYRVSKEAVDRARAGGGPSLIETVTMRMRGHSEHDDGSYVPDALTKKWEKKDPLGRFEQYLESKQLLRPSQKTEIETRVSKEVAEATEWALADPFPDPEDAVRGVYAD